MEMGAYIKQLRLKHDFSQEELGRKLDPQVNRAAINKWENGTVENIKRTHIKQLSVIFGVTPCDLMRWSDDESKILNIYTQLTKQHQDDVYEYAEMKLHKQNQTKVVELPKKVKPKDPTMVVAAHRDGEMTDEDREFINSLIEEVESGVYD